MRWVCLAALLCAAQRFSHCDEARSRQAHNPGHADCAHAGGSASLPWAHQRPPAVTLIGSRLALGKPAAVRLPEDSAAADAAAASVQHAAAGAEVAASGEATFQLDAASSNGSSSRSSSVASGGHAGSEAAASGHRRVPLLHPGYFTPASGPSYTPAPPEALIDAREPPTCLQQGFPDTCPCLASCKAVLAFPDAILPERVCRPPRMDGDPAPWLVSRAPPPANTSCIA